jgi:TctA family transporter
LFDIGLMMFFGIVGLVMVHIKWPRAPLLLGMVLGGLVEKYLFISYSRYDFDFLLRPIVIVILAVTVLSLVGPKSLRRFSRREKNRVP